MERTELTLHLPNGGTLSCMPGEVYQWGAEVTVTIPGRTPPVMGWTASEWGDDPEAVMGAIMSLATSGPYTHAMVPRSTLWKVLEHLELSTPPELRVHLLAILQATSGE